MILEYYFNPPTAYFSAPRHSAVEVAYFVLLLGANTFWIASDSVLSWVPINGITPLTR